jgi:hypothetical protein
VVKSSNESLSNLQKTCLAPLNKVKINENVVGFIQMKELKYQVFNLSVANLIFGK